MALLLSPVFPFSRYRAPEWLAVSFGVTTTHFPGGVYIGGGEASFQSCTQDGNSVGHAASELLDQVRIHVILKEEMRAGRIGAHNDGDESGNNAFTTRRSIYFSHIRVWAPCAHVKMSFSYRLYCGPFAWDSIM